MFSSQGSWSSATPEHTRAFSAASYAAQRAIASAPAWVLCATSRFWKKLIQLICAQAAVDGATRAAVTRFPIARFVLLGTVMIAI
jgi:hypothetical protein